MNTNQDVMMALRGQLREPMNMGVIGTNIVVVMNMTTKQNAQLGLMLIAHAIDNAMEAATTALLEFEEGFVLPLN